MCENTYQKIVFLLIVGIFLMATFVSIEIIKHIHNVSFNIGIISEKIGTLEEIVPLTKIKVYTGD
jgi:hypothetical protein